ncbi:PepSY domain-containing protein [Niveibacterium sp. SC-1]|uniref:PepSY-associated TM helix domain-containing protein n=1 Tax=Niveibacterium sp. SC-1 TaxID=3135646 RepID=UPI00311FDE75
MLSARALRTWSWLHKWTSLVCTVFMLLLCLTGLPLIFHHEIGHLLGTEAEPADMAADAPRASLDAVMQTALARHPGKGGMFVSQEEDDDRVWYVTLSDTPTSNDNLKQVAVDARSAQTLAEPQLDRGFMYVMRSLHIDLFSGLPGMLFLGFMALLLLIALVSGAVLYAPFMRKLRFAEVRRERSTRIKWLDLHNLLGIVTLVWFFVVGATGMINTWADLLVKAWQFGEMAEMVAPYKNAPPLTQLGSLEAAVQAARRQEPDMKIAFIAFPGTSFSSPHHYGVFMRGTEALTSRLLKPVLVDAQTAQVTDSRKLPWYLTALLVSQPLHFGDYGGKPMQIIWAALDIITLFVLGSGLYLWLAKRKTARQDATQPSGESAQLAELRS